MAKELSHPTTSGLVVASVATQELMFSPIQTSENSFRMVYNDLQHAFA